MTDKDGMVYQTETVKLRGLLIEANTEIARLDAVITRLGDEKKFIDEDYEFWWEDECKARIQYAIDNQSKSE